MSVSERLAQEDHILRGIRMTLSTFRSVSPEGGARRRGAVYASSPITSGLRLYKLMMEMGIKSIEVARSHSAFKTKVMGPNLADGERFGEALRGKDHGYPLVIVPGFFFAKGWAQEHYMSLWRQVIERYASKVAFNRGWEWSVGCVEEFSIAIESGKSLLDEDGNIHVHPRDFRASADLVRRAIDKVDEWGLDPKPLYDKWRQIDLFLDTVRTKRRVSVS